MCPSRPRPAATRKWKPVLRAALRRTGVQVLVETGSNVFILENQRFSYPDGPSWRPSMHLENLPALSGGRCGAFLSTPAVHVGIDSTLEAPRGVNYEEGAACRNLRVCIWTVLLGGRRQVAAGHRNPPTPLGPACGCVREGSHPNSETAKMDPIGGCGQATHWSNLCPFGDPPGSPFRCSRLG